MDAEEHRLLTRDKVTKMIRKSEGADAVDIVRYETKPGVPKGTNFSSEIVSLSVDARLDGAEEVKGFRWMVKVPTEDIRMYMGPKAMLMDKKEIQMYDVVIPRWKQMVLEAGAAGGDGDNLLGLNVASAPYTEWHEDIKDGFVVAMEDLREKGFVGLKKEDKSGLDVAHAKLALKQLAKFHALGRIYIEDEFGGIQEGLGKNRELTRDYFCAEPPAEMKEQFDKIKGKVVEGMMEILEAIQEPGQDMVGGLKDYIASATGGDIFGHRDSLYAPDKGGFNVLCHGDTWFSNMLFKYDGNGNPEACALVDLALSRWSSPATDIAYCLFLSMDPELRRKHTDDLLREYHESFADAMEKMGKDKEIYPLSQLLADYNVKCQVGFVMALWILPFVLLPKKDEGANLGQKSSVPEECLPAMRRWIGGTVLEMAERGHLKI